jgi:hypothetical protein
MYYFLENTCIVITGEVSKDEILASLSDIDLKLFHEAKSCDMNEPTTEKFPGPNCTEVSHIRLDGFQTPLVAIGWRCLEKNANIVDSVAVSILADLVSNVFNTGKHSMR